jgi:2-C-methyl-D-erythritol 4-phosphate cytidylyltransferase
MSATWCVVVAGGSGLRFGGLKQLEAIGGRRVVDHAVDAARRTCDGVVVVLPPDLISTAAADVPGADIVVAGGATRVDSARAGLAAVPASAEVVLVHDAARPLATAELFARVIRAVRSGAAAVVPAVPIADTVRSSSGELLDRSTLRASQTPQGFAAPVLRDAHEAARGSGLEATDDAALVAARGVEVLLIEGEPTNRKITDRADLLLAEAVLADRSDRRGRSDAAEPAAVPPGGGSS